MEQQKRNKQSSMPQSKSESDEQQKQLKEAKEVMKLKMLLDSVEQTASTPYQQAVLREFAKYQKL